MQINRSKYLFPRIFINNSHSSMKHFTSSCILSGWEFVTPWSAPSRCGSSKTPDSHPHHRSQQGQPRTSPDRTPCCCPKTGHCLAQSSNPTPPGPLHCPPPPQATPSLQLSSSSPTTLPNYGTDRSDPKLLDLSGESEPKSSFPNPHVLRQFS